MTEQDPDAAAPRTPVYLLIAQTLQNRIERGDFPVGSLLPKETDLATRHGVSRQTIRQAIRVLRDRQMVTARKGIGTTVEATRPRRVFSFSAGSVSELLELSRNTELSLLSQDVVAARAGLAAQLGCRPGRRYRRLTFVRRVEGERLPLSYVETFVDHALGRDLDISARLQTPLFRMIELATGDAVLDIAQEIRAVNVDDTAVLDALKCPAHSAALKITRRYFGSGRRMLLLSHNILPADRFFYAQQLTQAPDGGGASING